MMFVGSLWQGMRRCLACTAMTIAAAAVLALAVAVTGLYNVAASRDHLEVTGWFLEFGMRRSVAAHSALVKVPPLDDPGRIALGAAHFRDGCAPCHGAPGQPSGPIVRQMKPVPPSLSEAMPTWKPREVHWIVANGLKYTGMPAWPSPDREDEVWSVVAFLVKLPHLDGPHYRALARVDLDPAPPDLTPIGRPRQPGFVVRTCVRCHGDDRTPPISRHVPHLNGQSADYLALALAEYADGRRPSGFMQPPAAALDGETIAELARYFAGLRANPAPPRHAPADAVERGRRLAVTGDAGAGIPACMTCHSQSSLAIYPRLGGQHADYVAAQLRLFRSGLRETTPLGAVMTPMARRLSDGQIDDIAAYVESLARFDATPGPTP